ITEGVFGIGKDIGDLNGFALEHRSPDRSAAPRRPGLSPHVFKVLARMTVVRGVVIAPILSGRTQDPRLIRLAQARRRLYKRGEQGLEVEGGAADDLEHVGGGRLLLQGLS